MTPSNPSPNNFCADAIVEAVVADFRQRSEIGVAKYGTTLADAPRDPLAYLDHLQKELMDATIYIEKWKRDSQNYLRDTMLATLFAWCEGNGFEVDFQGNTFSIPFDTPTIFGFGMWQQYELGKFHFRYYQIGKGYIGGNLDTPADLLTLLSRLLPEGEG